MDEKKKGQEGEKTKREQENIQENKKLLYAAL